VSIRNKLFLVTDWLPNIRGQNYLTELATYPVATGTLLPELSMWMANSSMILFEDFQLFSSRSLLSASCLVWYVSE
jgi:hypothetical protein